MIEQVGGTASAAGPRPQAHVLAGALDRLAEADVLLVVCDFDGTLAAIVPDPASARAHPAGLAALVGLAALPGTTVALVSGRSLADLRTRSGAPRGLRLVGGHGAEPDDGGALVLDEAARLRRDALLAALGSLVDGIDGVQLEVKPTGAAVHVRRASRPDAARVLAAVRTGPATAPGVMTMEGKEVIELLVVGADKGQALDVLREDVGASAVLMVGDDRTDELAFARLRDGDVGVKVGPGPTVAGLRVDGPEQVVHLLEHLHRKRATRGSSEPERH